LAFRRSTDGNSADLAGSSKGQAGDKGKSAAGRASAVKRGAVDRQSILGVILHPTRQFGQRLALSS
jgi:hypothetical protein